MRSPIAALFGSLALLCGCGAIVLASRSCGAPSETAPDRELDVAVASDHDAPAWPAWGDPVPPVASAIERSLIDAELRRDPNADAITTALASNDPRVRTRAAWSLMRIGGPVAAKSAIAWLDDGADHPPGVLAAIAALAPPLPDDRDGTWAELQARLWQRYAVTEDPRAASALLLAIARIGGASSQAWLAADLDAPVDPSEIDRFVRATEAVAILCRRGQGLPARGVAAIERALDSDATEAWQAAAIALERCAGPSAEQLAGAVRSELVARLSDKVVADDDASARAAWAALAALGEIPSVIPDDVLGRAPRIWTAEVAAVRALAGNADGRRELTRRLAALDPAGIDGPRWHVVIEALQRIRTAIDGTPDLFDTLSPFVTRVDTARNDATARRKKALVLVRCELLTLAAIRTGAIAALEACADGRDGVPASHGAKLAVEALLQIGSAIPRAQKIDALLARAIDPRTDVAVAALSALADIDDPRVAPALRDALSGDDVGIVSAAAGAIAARAVDRERRDPDAVDPLLAAIARLSNDRAVEARIAAIDALGTLAGSAAAAGSPPQGDRVSIAPADSGTPAPVPASERRWLAQDIVALAVDPNQAVRDAARRALRHTPDLFDRFDAAVPLAMDTGFAAVVRASADAQDSVRGLVLHTDAGEVAIDLRGAMAPIAQRNLVALARAGYFESLTFHRVVPDFVVQGGDPRGDGYGGPGYVLPCEWSNLKYERGTVGIALAGKDTGGSQIFVTHGRAVHLDARFTVIGRVHDGMEVVDTILPYDAITRVEVVEEPAS